MRFHFPTLLLTAGVFYAFGANAQCTSTVDGASVCACVTGSPQGEYCGYCANVISCEEEDNCFMDVYECNPQGGCCHYGYRDSCASSASAVNFDCAQCPIQTGTVV